MGCHSKGVAPRRSTPTSEAWKAKRKLRHLLYGNMPHVHRIIYEVDERRKAVWVLHIRHGTRKTLKVSDLA